VHTYPNEHVAVAVNHHGAGLSEYRLATTARGYEGLESWALGLGEEVAFGVEGTGSYGAGLSRQLAGRGHTIIEVNRPDRSTRRRLGKSVPVDAEVAARAVPAAVAMDLPRSGLDKVGTASQSDLVSWQHPETQSTHAWDSGHAILRSG
jgi:transposase